MTTTLLTEGEYTIPDGYVVKREGNKLTIRPRKEKRKCVKHCRDCALFGRSLSTLSGLYERSVCKRRKKPNGTYYVAYHSDAACEYFREKTQPRGC